MIKLLRLVMIASLLTAAAGPATAYKDDYDNNCSKIENPEDIRAAEEIAEMSIFAEVGFKLRQKTCKGVELVKKLFRKESDADKIDADAVFEASKPAIDPVKVRQEYLKEERKAVERIKSRDERKRDEYLKSNPANDDAKERAEREDAAAMLARAREPLVPPPPLSEPVILPPAKQGGFIQIFQGRGGKAPAASPDGQPPKATDLDGEGVLMSDEGIQRGTFKDALLEGDGEEITSEGTWRGGNYQGGEIEGQGFEVGEKDGKLYVMDGNFVDDQPDGTVTMSYSDGTSQRVMWKDGKIVASGVVAALGKIPSEPVYKSPEQLAAESDAEFERKLQTLPSASALFALADELAEKGDAVKARRAYRTLMTRFSGSRLADLSAERLIGLETKPSLAASTQTTATSPNAQYESICQRDAMKLADFMTRNPSPTSPSTSLAISRMWGRCRTYDALSAQEYQNKLDEAEGARRLGYPDTPAGQLLISEIDRAIANPNYSVELGPVKMAPR